MRLTDDETPVMGRHFMKLAIVMAIFAGLGLLARILREIRLGFVTFAIFPPLVFALNFPMVQMVFSPKSARGLTQKFPPLSATTEVAFVQCFPDGVPFYLHRTTTLVTEDGNELTSASNYILFRLQNDPAWPACFVPLTNFDRWISQRKHPVYLVTREKTRPVLNAAGIADTDIHPLTPPYIGVLLPVP